MEVIAMSGMTVFYNHLANATKINIDSGFNVRSIQVRASLNPASEVIVHFHSPLPPFLISRQK